MPRDCQSATPNWSERPQPHSALLAAAADKQTGRDPAASAAHFSVQTFAPPTPASLSVAIRRISPGPDPRRRRSPRRKTRNETELEPAARRDASTRPARTSHARPFRIRELAPRIEGDAPRRSLWLSSAVGRDTVRRNTRHLTRTIDSTEVPSGPPRNHRPPHSCADRPALIHDYSRPDPPPATSLEHEQPVGAPAQQTPRDHHHVAAPPAVAPVAEQPGARARAPAARRTGQGQEEEGRRLGPACARCGL